LAYSNTLDVQLLQRSVERWRTIEEEWRRLLDEPLSAAPQLIFPVGCLVIGAPDQPFISSTLASVRRHELAHTVFDAPSLQQRHPEFHLAAEEIAILEHEAGYLDAERSWQACLDIATAHGAEVRFNEQVQHWQQLDDGTVEVRATGGRVYRTRRLVLTVGAWASQLFGSEYAWPLEIRKSTCMWFRPSTLASSAWRPFSQSPAYIWAMAGQSLYGFPRHPELAESVKVGGRPLQKEPSASYSTPESVERAWTDENVEMMREMIRTRLPTLNGELHRGETCLTTNTPSSDFLIAPHPRAPHVILVSACSGHGFKFAPAIGEIVAEMCTHPQPSSFSPELLSRFSLTAHGILQQ
jgi:sarcosine oxidase